MAAAMMTIPPWANDHIFTRRTAMARSAPTSKTAMTGFLSRRLGKGHIFGTDVALTAGESFGGIFMGLFCLSPFSVKFALLTGERSTGQDFKGRPSSRDFTESDIQWRVPPSRINPWTTVAEGHGRNWLCGSPVRARIQTANVVLGGSEDLDRVAVRGIGCRGQGADPRGQQCQHDDAEAEVQRRQ